MPELNPSSNNRDDGYYVRGVLVKNVERVVTPPWSSIIARQRGRLDWNYVFEQLKPLCELKGTPEVVDHVRRLMISQQEQQHRQGYEQDPPAAGEFDVWENEQVWPDG